MNANGISLSKRDRACGHTRQTRPSIALLCLAALCLSVFNHQATAAPQDTTPTSDARTVPAPGQRMIDLPLAVTDKLDREEGFAVDNDPLTEKTAQEIAQEEEAMRAYQEEEERRRQAFVAAKEAGLCADDAQPIPEACLYHPLSASFGSTGIPRYAAPFQVQFLINEAGAPTDLLLPINPRVPEWEARHVCGGSLIAPGWAVTAAHCFTAPIKETPDKDDYRVDAWAYSVRLDVENIASDPSKAWVVEEIIIHPKYKMSDNANDIALVRFTTEASSLGDVIPWFSGTNASDNHTLYEAWLTEDGINIEGYDGPNISINPVTRRIARTDAERPVSVPNPRRFSLEYRSSRHVYVSDATLGTSVKIGRSRLKNAKGGVDPTGTYAVLIGDLNEGEIWDVSRKKRIETFDVDQKFQNASVMFAPDGSNFYLGNQAGESEIRTTKTGARVAVLNHSLPIANVKPGPKGQIIVESLFGTAELIDLRKAEVAMTLYHGGGAVQTDWDDRHIMTWTNDGRIRLFDLTSGEQTFHYIHDPETLSQYEFAPVPADPSRVQQIRLSIENPDPDRSPDLTTYGWGKTHYEATNVASAVLRKLSLTGISWEECNRLRDERNAANPQLASVAVRAATTDPSAFCAIGSGRKTCRGDSGGPLLDGDTLVGVVSRGSGLCWDDQAPTTFTSIPKANEWIHKVICQPRPGVSPPRLRPELCRFRPMRP